MTLIKRVSLLAALVAAPLAAQQPAAAAGPQCPVDLNQPKDLITLYNITRPRAITLQPGEERTKVLEDIFKTRSDRVAFVKGDPTLPFADVADIISICHDAGIDKVGLVTKALEEGQ